ncbi:odorant receptor 256 [Nasonia vitripennis]|uniref:Odorant receptor n=1 Tax=Nasonia vitripennis TaxID=7425 RepID=A0A7M6UVX3_NASVI|nr:odorant receptor 256 [Nasonia vitripennis]
METELRKYERYSRDLKCLLVLSGIWPDFHPIIQPLLGCFAAFVCFVTVIAFLNFSIHHITNVVVLTKSFGLVISFFSSFLKICVFLWHHDDLVYLKAALTDRFNTDNLNKSFRRFTLAKVNVFANLFYILTIAVGLTTGMAVVLLIISLRHGKYVMLYPSIFPFSYEPGSRVYWILLMVELFANLFVWAVTSGVDSVFGWYTLQICGEFRVLAHKFQNLKSSENYRDDLKECVERHYVLMKTRDVLQDVFGFLTILLALTSAIVQCMLVFQAIQVFKNLSLGMMVFLIAYITLKVVQAFIYAWYGQLIAEESEVCLGAIYNARWAGSGDTRFMSDVVIVLSQKPLIFRANGCMSLKMDIFIKILNTSVSYFFLLQTLDEGSEHHQH